LGGRLSSWVKIRLHTKKQLPRLPQSGGGFLTLSSQAPTHVEVELGCDNNNSLFFTLIIQCFIVLKLIVFKGNIWTKSGPVDQLRFLPVGVILNFFRFKLI
jgi:hypothetical protein